MASSENGPAPVLICGLVPGDPPHPEGFERWAIALMKDDSFDAYFETHDHWREYADRWERHYCSLPKIYMFGPLLPNGEPYPAKAVVNLVGRYIEGTIAWMVALAIYQQRPKIHIWGVTGEENYEFQRPNLEYLFGFARARGIEVEILSESTLMSSATVNDRYATTGLYGLTEWQ